MEFMDIVVTVIDAGLMVVPVKEIDSEVEVPVTHKGGRPMTRAERRKRTYAKAAERARQDRKGRERGWKVGSEDLGRYFKAKAAVGSVYREGRLEWDNDMPFHDIKRNRVAEQRADIELGLAEYYAGEVATKGHEFVADRYEVHVGNLHALALVASVDTYKEADEIATRSAALTRCVQARIKKLRGAIAYHEERIEEAKKNLRELETAYPVESGRYPCVSLECLDSDKNIVAYDFYCDFQYE